MAAKRARAVTATAVLEGGIAIADQNPPPPPKWWIPVGLLFPEGTMEVLRSRKPKLRWPSYPSFSLTSAPLSFFIGSAFSKLSPQVKANCSCSSTPTSALVSISFFFYFYPSLSLAQSNCQTKSFSFVSL